MNRISPLMLTLTGLAGCFALASSLPNVLAQSLIVESKPDVHSGRLETTDRRIVVHTVDGANDAIQQLVTKWRQTDAKDSAARKESELELTKLLAAQFDEHQQQRERQIEELQKRLDQLREIQTRRAANKDDIVERHTQNLLLDADGMGWGGEGKGPFIETEDVRSGDVLFKRDPLLTPSVDWNIQRN